MEDDSDVDFLRKQLADQGVHLSAQMKRLTALDERLRSLEAGKSPPSKTNPQEITGTLQNSSSFNEISTSTMLVEIEHDSFLLMILNPICSSAYIFGLFVFLLQATLVALLVYTQLADSQNENSTPFHIPVRVDAAVRVGQYIALFLILWFQRDLQTGVQLFSLLWKKVNQEIIQKEVMSVERNEEGVALMNGNEHEIGEDNYEDDQNQETPTIPRCHMLFPCVLKIIQGALVIALSVILVIQSDALIDIMMNFAALMFISEIDNILYEVAGRGFFGSWKLAKKVSLVHTIEIEDTDDQGSWTGCCSKFWKSSFFYRNMVMVLVVVSMIAVLTQVAVLQESGFFFEKIYPNCKVPLEDEYWKFDPNDSSLGANIHVRFDVKNVKNGVCDRVLNVQECKDDGGDCSWFNENFPHCDVPHPHKIGDGKCDGVFYSASGHDIAGSYNSEACGWDGGDCKEANDQFSKSWPSCNVGYGFSSLIGDGVCNGAEFFSEECGWEDKDCDKCPASNLTLIGDGKCDGGLYNSLECGFDGRDCIEFNKRYPNCVGSIEHPYLIANGECDGDGYNTEACKWDGGDCFVPGYPHCHVNQPLWIGDGICNEDGGFNTEACGWDGEDCVALNTFNEKWPNCEVPDYTLVNNGICNQDDEYNSEECGFDGGDCLDLNAFNETYPDCEVHDITNVGDGYCDYDLGLNTIDCMYDGGDCTNVTVKDCIVVDKALLGNGRCDGGTYNTQECLYDHGDCDQFNVRYPNCIGTVEHPYLIDDGICNWGDYNTEDCEWDGGDCLVLNDFNVTWPGCVVSDISLLGNNICEIESNNEACGWDGGDCIIAEYPDCHVRDPSKIGNGQCDEVMQENTYYFVGGYNTEACGWDGNDCIEFNSLYPDCNVAYPWKVNNGKCDGSVYNTEACGWDGGDCGECEQIVPEPNNLGDGRCDGGVYNTEICNFDGGDCLEFNSKYPDCKNAYPERVGNGNCDIVGDHNTEKCGFDGGDCIEFNEKWPDCQFEWYFVNDLGDGICQFGQDDIPFTPECGCEGGDCGEVVNGECVPCELDFFNVCV